MRFAPTRRSFLAVVASCLAGSWAVGKAAGMRRHEPAEGQTQMGVEMGLVESHGGPIGFELIDHVNPWIAQPETILFHHGLGTVMQMWCEWLPHLVDRYRILRFDVRGHGRSAKSAGIAPTLDVLGDDVFAVADAAGIDRFHFVGESMGGTVGLAIAARRGQRLQSLTICNSPYRGQALPSAEPIRALMAQGMDKWSAATMQIRFLPGELPPDQWRWFEDVQAQTSADFFIAALRMLGEVDLGNELSRITRPVMILGGDRSQATPPELLNELRGKLPDACLQLFPRAKHGLAFSRGSDCSRALRQFLDGLER